MDIGFDADRTPLPQRYPFQVLCAVNPYTDRRRTVVHIVVVYRTLPPRGGEDCPVTSSISTIPPTTSIRTRIHMGQLFSREVSVLASFDYVDFDNAPGTDLNTPRFWEGDPSESTLPTPKYVRSPNVTVRDIRGQESEFEFSKDGFQLLAFPSAHVAHPDNQEDTQAYLQETAARVRNLLNASQAFVFDYRVSYSLCSLNYVFIYSQFRVNKPRPADRQHHQKNSPGFVGRKKPDAPFTKPHVGKSTTIRYLLGVFLTLFQIIQSPKPTEDCGGICHQTKSSVIWTVRPSPGS